MVGSLDGTTLTRMPGLELVDTVGDELGTSLCRLATVVGSKLGSKANPEVGEPLATDTGRVDATVGSRDSAWVVANTEGELLAEMVGPTLFEADGVVLGSTLC